MMEYSGGFQDHCRDHLATFPKKGGDNRSRTGDTCLQSTYFAN